MIIPPGKRRLLLAATTLAALLMACGPGQMCESDRDIDERLQRERISRETMMRTPPPTSTPTPATAAAATATPPAGTPTPAPFGGKIALGFDHPPFSTGNAGLGGNSVGIVCGVLTNVPAGSIITINLTGGTGAPASVNSPVAGDGTFVLPFPIMSFGPMNATIGGVKTAAGAAVPGSVTPAALAVAGGPDVACNAR